MSGSVSVPDIPGDPDALITAAHALDGASGQLEGLASSIHGTNAPLNDSFWSGIAAIAADAACQTFAQPLRDGDLACHAAAKALRSYAHVLRETQAVARKARQAAVDAASEAARAQHAADAAASAPVPDPVAHSHAMNRVNAAQDTMVQAAAAGINAYQVAESAGRQCAALLAEAALMAPEPPPPPPPPQADPDEGRNWFERRIDDAQGFYNGAKGLWDEVGSQGDPTNPHSPAFAHDLIDGAVGSTVATGKGLWDMVKATNNEYGQLDPEGQEEARDRLDAAAQYMKDHPGDALLAMLGADELTGGHPGRWYGEMGLAALTTLATGGAGGVTTRVTTATGRAIDRAALAAELRASLKVKDLTGKGVLDYTDGFLGDAKNFAGHPSLLGGSLPYDRYVVTFGNSALEAGSNTRSLKWWAELSDAQGLTSVFDLKEKLALPDRWSPDGHYQLKDEIIIAKIPAGTNTTRLDGPAGPQDGFMANGWPMHEPGGGNQIRFKNVDSGWIIARMDASTFMNGHAPRGVPGAH